MKQSLIPHIELREESGEHYYVTEADIMYAVACGRYLKVTLTNKKVLSVLSTVDNLYCQLDNYPSLFPINHKVLINGRYLKKIHFMTAVMTDGERFSIAPTSRAYAKYALEEFKPENSSKAH